MYLTSSNGPFWPTSDFDRIGLLPLGFCEFVTFGREVYAESQVAFSQQISVIMAGVRRLATRPLFSLFGGGA